MKRPEIIVFCIVVSLILVSLSGIFVSFGKADDGSRSQSVDDGYEEYTTIEAMVNNLTSVDEAWLTVRNPEGKEKNLYLVYGNSPGELVCDYHCDPLIDKATSEHSEKWEVRKQPTCQI